MPQSRQSFLLAFKRDQTVVGVGFFEIEPASSNQILCRSYWIVVDVTWMQDVREDAVANVG